MLGHLCHFFVPFLVLFSLYTSFQYVFLIDWKDENQNGGGSEEAKK